MQRSLQHALIVLPARPPARGRWRMTRAARFQSERPPSAGPTPTGCHASRGCCPRGRCETSATLPATCKPTDLHCSGSRQPKQHRPLSVPSLASSNAASGQAVIGIGWLYALHARSALARGKLWQAMIMLDDLRNQRWCSEISDPLRLKGGFVADLKAFRGKPEILPASEFVPGQRRFLSVGHESRSRRIRGGPSAAGRGSRCESPGWAKSLVVQMTNSLCVVGANSSSGEYSRGDSPCSLW